MRTCIFIEDWLHFFVLCQLSHEKTATKCFSASVILFSLLAASLFPLRQVRDDFKAQLKLSNTPSGAPYAWHNQKLLRRVTNLQSHTAFHMLRTTNHSCCSLSSFLPWLAVALHRKSSARNMLQCSPTHVKVIAPLGPNTAWLSSGVGTERMAARTVRARLSPTTSAASPLPTSNTNGKQCRAGLVDVSGAASPNAADENQ